MAGDMVCDSGKPIIPVIFFSIDPFFLPGYFPATVMPFTKSVGDPKFI